MDIARKFGLRFAELHELNPGVKWERLQIGQKLIIRAPETGRTAPQ
jgi:LysM repeat protein